AARGREARGREGAHDGRPHERGEVRMRRVLERLLGVRVRRVARARVPEDRAAPAPGGRSGLAVVDPGVVVPVGVFAPRMDVEVPAARVPMDVHARARERVRRHEEGEREERSLAQPTPGEHRGEGRRQPFAAPISTMGPVGAFEPPAGSTDTANAVTLAGSATRAARAATAPSGPTVKRPAGSGACVPRIAHSSYVRPAAVGATPETTTAVSPEVASTTTRPVPATPGWGASVASIVRGPARTRSTSPCADTAWRRLASVRSCASRRATSSAFAAASAAWRAARSFARRVSRARSAPTTTTAPAATAPTTRHRPTGRRAKLAGARRAAP